MNNYVNLPDELKTYINEWKAKKGSLIMILRFIQDYYGYVPKDTTFILAKELKVPLARIYEVLTFYNYFKLEQPAKYRISVCMGTACYLKGAPEILEAIKSLNNPAFTLDEVRCMGCCGLAPVVKINEKIYGKAKKEEILDILEGLCQKVT